MTVPVVAVLLAEKVSVALPLPGAAIELGVKVAVTPEGKPDTDNETTALKPPLTVLEMVVLPEAPWATDKLLGAAVKAKSGVAAAVMVSAMVVLCVIPPPVAFTVTLTVPVVVVLLAENVSVALPLPGAAIEAGLRLAVTPEGKLETESEIAELKPPLTAVEIDVLPVLPCVTDRLAGEALTVKFGTAVATTVRATVVV